MVNTAWFMIFLSTLNVFKEILEYLGITDGIKKAVEDEVDKELQILPHPIIHDFEKLLCNTQEIYQTVDRMLLKYLNLEFDQTSKKEGRMILLELEEGQLLSQVDQARPSALKITAIFQSHVHPWLSRHIEESEQEQMGVLIKLLSAEDKNVIYQLEQIAKQLAEVASITLDLVDKDQLDEANLKIKAYRKETLSLRRVVNETFGKLLEFEQVLLQHSGINSPLVLS